MFKYILQRIGLMLLTLFIITLICFVLFRLLPMEPPRPGDKHYETLMAQREAMGLGKPIMEQFWIYMKGIFTKWDFGLSFYMKPGMSVWELFSMKLPPTILVNLYSILLAIPIGIVLGIWAALKKNTWVDHTISTLTMVCISVPSFVYGAVLQYLLCFKLKQLTGVQIFPSHVAGLDEYAYLSWGMFRSMLPAVFSLSFGTIAGFTRTTRAELTEVLTSEFMLLARTKGLTKRQATVRHAMKNCMVVVLPSIMGSFIGILSGSFVIEKIFGVAGVGQLYITAFEAKDYNVLMLDTIFYTIIGLLAAVVVDVSYGFIDPRIRMGSKK